jgi:YihY family inner membrane protein
MQWKPETWPLVGRFVRLAQRYGRDECGHYAAALTYYGLLSVFPLMLLALSVAGIVLAHAGQREILSLIERLARGIPGLGPLIGKNISAVIRGRGIAAVIGVIGIIWGGTGAIAAARAALARVFRFDKPINTFLIRLRSLGLLFILGPLLLISVAATGLATRLSVIAILGVAGGLLVNVGLFWIAYRIFVPTSVAGVRQLLPGAVAGAIAFTVLEVAGSFYTKMVVQHAVAIFGIFAGIIGALVVLNLAATIFLYGAEINATRIQEAGHAPRPG